MKISEINIQLIKPANGLVAFASAEQIKQFQVLYEWCFGRQISEQRAYEMEMKLVMLVKLTCTAQGKAQKKCNRVTWRPKNKS